MVVTHFKVPSLHPQEEADEKHKEPKPTG